MNKSIYKGNVLEVLNSLADRSRQESIWLNKNNPEGRIDCFVESVNTLDSCLVWDYVKDGEILFDRETTAAFQELETAVDAVNEYRPEAEIVADPLMEVVRQKAAKVLELIEVSDRLAGTVEIFD